MYLSEADQPQKIVEIEKKRFIRDYRDFSLKYPALKDNLFKFIKFRLTHRPDEPFGSKDSAMTFAPGFRRCHLIHGRAILIYRIEGNKIQLCAILDHAEMDAKGSNSIANFLTKLKPDSFEEMHNFSTPQETPQKLTLDQMADVKTVIYELAASDPAPLQAALNGNYNGLAEYVIIGLNLDVEIRKMVQLLLNSFGEEKLKILIKAVMNSVAGKTPKTESILL